MLGNNFRHIYVSHFKDATAPLIQLKTSLSSVASLPTSSAIQMSFTKYETDTGDEKVPLLIMHGLFGSKSNWNSMSKAFLKQLNRNIIAMDARNHGESRHTNEFSYHHLVVDINRFFEDYKLRQASLLGHSMGGRAMMLFALNYPEKVEKLIIVDISPYPSSKRMHGMKVYFDALKGVKLPNDLTMPEARKQADQQLSQSIADGDIRQFLLTNLIKKNNGDYGWRVNLDTLSVKFDSAIVDFPQNINLICTKPTLFIGGTKSDYLRPSDESGIINLFPAAKFIYLDSGHWVHAEKPQEFISVVSDFINSPRS
ncbi:sn-1-specific diacylglycerol lipase ABHD11-like [Rhodnius prolixus]|uniref:sn-1-specific diacylglycerol lipase ABHD11-like n=1 Tax=Rhodnius prolixus TaxID=13249 RepID=UPI003D187835